MGYENGGHVMDYGGAGDYGSHDEGGELYTDSSFVPPGEHALGFSPDTTADALRDSGYGIGTSEAAGGGRYPGDFEAVGGFGAPHHAAEEEDRLLPQQQAAAEGEERRRHEEDAAQRAALATERLRLDE